MNDNPKRYVFSETYEELKAKADKLAEAVRTSNAFMEEVGLPAYQDSNLDSLLKSLGVRAKTLLSGNLKTLAEFEGGDE